MWGKVDFIGIGAGWLKERLILTAGAEGKEAKKGVTKSECTRGQLSDQHQYLFLIDSIDGFDIYLIYPPPPFKKLM